MTSAKKPKTVRVPTAEYALLCIGASNNYLELAKTARASERNSTPLFLSSNYCMDRAIHYKAEYEKYKA